MKKSLGIITTAAAMLLLSAGVTLAAANPSGTGQPGVECGDEGAETIARGFMTDGFAIAEERYAGSEDSASLAHAHSEHAVSQYDVACFQLSQKAD
jgi:hypothetical protein